jgi:hypothetical protein
MDAAPEELPRRNSEAADEHVQTVHAALEVSSTITVPKRKGGLPTFVAHNFIFRVQTRKFDFLSGGF